MDRRGVLRWLALTLGAWPGVAAADDPGAGTFADSDEGVTTLLPTSAMDALEDESDRKVLKYNKQIQSQNRVPGDFPRFLRKGFDMVMFADGFKEAPSGFYYKEYEPGIGLSGKDGDELTFHYTGYNEDGAFIDSSYKQRQPAQIRLGIKGLIPGFELALREMKPGSRWRVVVPPKLGPPVGPSTFFSAKQYEVFDINLLGVKSCTRKSVFGIVSTVTCE